MNCNCDNNLVSIFRNDDTGAFKETDDAPFIRINRPKVRQPDGTIVNLEHVYKAEFKCGNLPLMTFGDGSSEIDFPIDIELVAAETSKLQKTDCYLKVYDRKGLGETCRGTISFVVKDEVV